MEIIERPKMKQEHFGDLAGGEVFRFSNAVYMKICGGENCNAVNAETGAVRIFRDDSWVTPVDASLVIQ